MGPPHFSPFLFYQNAGRGVVPLRECFAVPLVDSAEEFINFSVSKSRSTS